jgi:hypothetical protein
MANFESGDNWLGDVDARLIATNKEMHSHL